jgi:serine/threonine protein phosphatase PrpC
MIRVASLSLQGKRSSNQDRVLIVPNTDWDDGIVAVLADGMGGMQSGNHAAQIAVDTIGKVAADLLVRMSHDATDARRFLAEAYQRSNDAIRSYAQARAQTGAVGTTLVTLVARRSRYLVINSGDSRAYRVDRTGVKQITRDHTAAEALVRDGLMTPQDYETSPLRNHLTRCLGPNEDCEPELFPNSDFGMIDFECTFLLCSDGFYSKLSSEDLAQLGSDSLQLERLLENLATKALQRGSADNLSAIAVRFESPRPIP